MSLPRLQRQNRTVWANSDDVLQCELCARARIGENPIVDFARFVVWRSASISVCAPFDEHRFMELLSQHGRGSLESLNGASPAEFAEDSVWLSEVLLRYDLGLLARAFLPGELRPSDKVRSPPSAQNVNVLNLSVRSANCLEHAGITTVEELSNWSDERLLTIKNMGRKSVNEIRAKLEALHQSPQKDWPAVPPNAFPISVLLAPDNLPLDEHVKEKLARAGIVRVDDIVTRSRLSLRYWADLNADELTDLEDGLAAVGLHPDWPLPQWMSAHYSELQNAFQEDLERFKSTERNPPSDPGPPKQNHEPASLEDELDTYFSAGTDERKRKIVGRLMGWDGGTGTTLEQAGQENDLTRERVRQILVKSLRPAGSFQTPILNRVIDFVARRAPVEADVVESALMLDGLLRSSFRLEGLEAAAKHFGIPVPWSIETFNSRRDVVDSSVGPAFRQFMSAARRRVSHYGTTCKEYVVADIPCELSASTLDLCCSMAEGLQWLDESHQWFWVPTKRNSVLNRLAKILRVASRLRLSAAREGILRDRRMEGVELPPEIFKRLCHCVHWCQVEDDHVVATSDIPTDEDDSNETLLIGLLRRYGPVMRRRDLWTIANEAGVEKVSFDRLLGESNVIVKPDSELYALIGSDLSALPQPLPERQHVAIPDQLPEFRLAAPDGDDEGVLVGCNPSDGDFLDSILRRFYSRSSGLRASGLWSLMELGFSDEDFRILRRWGKECAVDFRDAGKTRRRCGDIIINGLESLALAFLAYCSEIGRNVSNEGELWPSIEAEIGDGLKKQVFASPANPKPRIREATESVCTKFGIRHVFGREGEQSWFRSVFLQFGMTRNGWRRLPWWLSNASRPTVSVELLLTRDSGVQSSSFVKLWQTLQRLRWGQISGQNARESLRKGCWITSTEVEDLIAATLALPEISRSEGNSEPDVVPSTALIGPPLLIWRDEPRFELPVNGQCKWLTANRYVLVLPGNKRVPVIRDANTYRIDLPSGKIEVELRDPVVQIDLQRFQTSCLLEPVNVTLVPQDSDFAFYSSTGRSLGWAEDSRGLREGCKLLCRSLCEVTVEPLAPFTRHVFGGEWIVRSYGEGIPAGFEIRKGEEVLWTSSRPTGPQPADAVTYTVLCTGGHWGDKATFILRDFKEGTPSHLLVGEKRAAFEPIASGGFRAFLRLSPDCDYTRARPQIEFELDGRLRRVGAALQMGSVTGVAIEAENGWKTFIERGTLDADQLRRRLILARVPSGFNGDQIASDDWAWMEGDHFCGRPRDRASVIGESLYALGDSLTLSPGPYNRPMSGQSLVRNVVRSGLIHWIEQSGSEYQLQLRNSVEFDSDYELWLWNSGSSLPEKVRASDWIQHEDACLIAPPSGTAPMALAISFRGVWLGARPCRSGWDDYAALISSTSDWQTTARWLKWWRVPLLHEALRKIVFRMVNHAPAATLIAWMSAEPFEHGADLLETDEAAWGAIIRTFLWEWRPDAANSAVVLTDLGLLSGDFDLDESQPWEQYEPLLATHPLLLAQLAGRGLPSLYPNRERKEWLSIVATLRNQLLGCSSFSERSQLDKALLAARLSAARAMAVDDAFVSRSLLPDAVRLMQGTLTRHHNLRVAIANSQAVREYLVAAVLDMMVRGELQ